ncbi:MAG: 50S ribosomal protein L18Ae [Candidatus Thermoplasmatota archaeon]
MKAFRVCGTFLMKPEWQRFAKEVAADDKEDAMEIALSDIGSRHRVKRRDIKIEEVVEIPFEEIESPTVRIKAAR